MILDFSKAFYLINQKMLYENLNHYGIGGAAQGLISSYLQHQHQFVAKGNESSQVNPGTSGVPQGSIMGPFLFILMRQ